MLYMVYRKIINFPSAVLNFFVLKRKQVSRGKNLQVWGNLKIFGKGKIVLGNDVTITSSVNVNPTAGGGGTFLITKHGSCIKIGDGSGISNTSISADESVEVGKNVLIGSCCMIADNDFHPLDAEIRRVSQRSHIKTAPIKICDDVFIGARCIILKGVTIGARSVVGAGSVVTKNIPADEVWAGNPARFVKSLKRKQYEQ